MQNASLPGPAGGPVDINKTTHNKRTSNSCFFLRWGPPRVGTVGFAMARRVLISSQDGGTSLGKVSKYLPDLRDIVLRQHILPKSRNQIKKCVTCVCVCVVYVVLLMCRYGCCGCASTATMITAFIQDNNLILAAVQDHSNRDSNVLTTH